MSLPSSLHRLTLMPIACALVLCACSSLPSHSAAPRTASNVPAQFVVEDNGSTRALQAGEGCRSPLRDPRDQTRLVLEQSRNGTGDYAVPDGAYGAAKGELLRIDCANGQPLGLVR